MLVGKEFIKTVTDFVQSVGDELAEIKMENNHLKEMREDETVSRKRAETLNIKLIEENETLQKRVKQLEASRLADKEVLKSALAVLKEKEIAALKTALSSVVNEAKIAFEEDDCVKEVVVDIPLEEEEVIDEEVVEEDKEEEEVTIRFTTSDLRKYLLNVRV